jgi:hypothetical protein
MGLLSALSRSGRHDGESRLRHLDQAGRSLTYLTIAGKVGRLAMVTLPRHALEVA